MNQYIKKRLEKYIPAYDYLKQRFSVQPAIAIVLGSGLGVFADELTDKIIVPTEDIPGFPKSTVEGHSGTIVFGFIESIPVLAFKGRIHFYEGYDISDTYFSSVLSYLFGIEKIILTNVSGGINFEPGEIVLLKDHLNATFRDPLRMNNLDFNTDLNEKENPFYHRVISLCNNFYSQRLIGITKKVGLINDINIKEGVYVWTLGPSYETPSEIKMFKVMGADMVGMSTIPEVIAAKILDLEVLAVSFISNYAAGIIKQKLSHHDVIEMGEKYKEKLKLLLQKTIIEICK